MTHEYVIALGGRILGSGGSRVDGAAGDADGTRDIATAIAWAADRILAIGTDDAVSSISRGDSTFLDLDGCGVTGIPRDLEAAEAAARGAWERGDRADLASMLVAAGQPDPIDNLEVGAPAELAIWAPDPPRVVALVRAGAFTTGDAHAGPLRRRGPGALTG
jgi:hypothetical protein